MTIMTSSAGCPHDLALLLQPSVPAYLSFLSVAWGLVSESAVFMGVFIASSIAPRRVTSVNDHGIRSATSTSKANGSVTLATCGWM
jgi:hypothetical protein